MRTWGAWSGAVAAAVLAAAAVSILIPYPANGQRHRNPAPDRRELPELREPTRKQQPGAKETLEADVSARNVGVGPGFTGVEIVVFGAIDNSLQPSPESGYYDLIIVVEGIPGRIVVRHRSKVAGIWVNTSSVT